MINKKKLIFFFLAGVLILFTHCKTDDDYYLSPGVDLRLTPSSSSITYAALFAHDTLEFDIEITEDRDNSYGLDSLQIFIDDTLIKPGLIVDILGTKYNSIKLDTNISETWRFTCKVIVPNIEGEHRLKCNVSNKNNQIVSSEFRFISLDRNHILKDNIEGSLYALGGSGFYGYNLDQDKLWEFESTDMTPVQLNWTGFVGSWEAGNNTRYKVIQGDFDYESVSIDDLFDSYFDNSRSNSYVENPEIGDLVIGKTFRGLFILIQITAFEENDPDDLWDGVLKFRYKKTPYPINGDYYGFSWLD